MREPKNEGTLEHRILSPVTGSLSRSGSQSEECLQTGGRCLATGPGVKTSGHGRAGRPEPFVQVRDGRPASSLFLHGCTRACASFHHMHLAVLGALSPRPARRYRDARTDLSSPGRRSTRHCLRASLPSTTVGPTPTWR